MQKYPSQIKPGDTIVRNTFRYKVSEVKPAKDGNFVISCLEGLSIIVKHDETVEVSYFFDIHKAPSATRSKPTMVGRVSID